MKACPPTWRKWFSHSSGFPLRTPWSWVSPGEPGHLIPSIRQLHCSAGTPRTKGARSRICVYLNPEAPVPLPELPEAPGLCSSSLANISLKSAAQRWVCPAESQSSWGFISCSGGSDVSTSQHSSSFPLKLWELKRQVFVDLLNVLDFDVPETCPLFFMPTFPVSRSSLCPDLKHLQSSVGPSRSVKHDESFAGSVAENSGWAQELSDTTPPPGKGLTNDDTTESPGELLSWLSRVWIRNKLISHLFYHVN